jgi:RNA polymerase sigma-70 factor (ECF subfamily)
MYRRKLGIVGTGSEAPAAAGSIDKPHAGLPDLLPALVSFLRRFTRDAGRANDLAQEAAVRALNAKESPTNHKAYRVWLYQIARNAVVDDIRRRSASMQLEPEHTDCWAADRSMIATLTVRQALTRLSEEHRQVLILVDIQGFSYGEAAKRLGVPSGTVMSRIARGRAALLGVIAQGDAVQ